MDEENVSTVNEKKANLIVVIIFMCFLGGIIGVICIGAYLSNILPKNISIEQLENYENDDLVQITKVSNSEKYFFVEASLLQDFKEYEVYIGLKNKNGELRFFRTKLYQEDNHILSVINKNDIDETSEIFVAYMCDDKNLLIETNRIVGEIDEE
jgi:hypothetical protein